MSQEKPAERVSASAPRRYKAAPLIATITVVVLVIACAAEGYLIYLKQLQIVSGSMDSEVIKGELTKLQTNLEQANRSVTRYGDLVGYYDLGELEEKVRDAQPPSARGYITKLETDLQVMATKLDGLQRERDTLKKDRDKAFAEKTAAETTFREELGKADQQVRQLEQDLKNEKAAHTTAVEDLQAQVTEWKGKYEKSKSDYEEVRLRHDLEQAKRQFASTGQAARVFKDFLYRTLESWSRSRRVVGKAEYLPKGANPRFVVTSLSPTRWPAQTLYEQEYCGRGEMENRIKEQQLWLFADRTSASTMRANQLRLWLSSVAYTLMLALRRVGLKGTELARAQCGTIRTKLLKIGALVRVTVRKVWVSLSESFPYVSVFRRVYAHLRSQCPVRLRC